MHTRQLAFAIDPKLIDDERRAVPVTVSSDTPVGRNDPWTGERFEEVLSHDPSAVDLERAPLPVIESHDQTQLNLGVVEDLVLAGGRMRGILRLGNQERATEIWNDIKSGIIRNLSISYETLADAVVEGVRHTVTAWRPLEVSFVAVPADPNSGIGRARTPMENDTTPAAPAAPETRTNVSGLTDDHQRTLLRAEELDRRTAIEGLFRGFQNAYFDPDTPRAATFNRLRERCLFDPFMTLERAREEAWTLLAESATPEPTITWPPPMASRSQPALPVGPGLTRRTLGPEQTSGGPKDAFFDAAGDALLLRAGYRLKDPHPEAEGLRHMTCQDVARTLLQRNGINPAGMAPTALFARAYPDTPSLTSNFPLLLGDMLNKALRSGQETVNVTFRGWCNIRTANDYRDIRVLSLGSAPNLPPVAEGQDYQNYTPTEEAEEYAISKSGQIFQITREALVNDDLSAFSMVPGQMIASALRYKSDIIYSVLSTNAAMSDTFPLFDAVNHGNDLATVTPLDPVQLGLAVALLRKQVATGGGYMNLTPRYLLVSPDDEQNARTLLSGYWNYQAGGATQIQLGVDGAAPLYPEMALVVDPRVTAPAFYVVTTPGEALSVELAVLTGTTEGVSTETEEVFKNDTSSWKVRCEAGAAAADWRGIVRGGVV